MADKGKRLSETQTERIMQDALDGSLSWGLTVLHSPDRHLEGRTIQVDSKLRLGRSAADDIDLPVADPLLSRRHCTISRQGRLPIFQIEDHGSKNGTYVDGARTAQHSLPSGTIVRIGGTLFEFGVLDPSLENVSDDAEMVGRSVAFRKTLNAV